MTFKNLILEAKGNHGIIVKFPEYRIFAGDLEKAIGASDRKVISDFKNRDVWEYTIGKKSVYFLFKTVKTKSAPGMHLIGMGNDPRVMRPLGAYASGKDFLAKVAKDIKSSKAGMNVSDLMKMSYTTIENNVVGPTDHLTFDVENELYGFVKEGSLYRIYNKKVMRGDRSDDVPAGTKGGLVANPKNIEVKGTMGVWIAEGAQVLDGAKVKGWSYVGGTTVIKDKAVANWIHSEGSAVISGSAKIDSARFYEGDILITDNAKVSSASIRGNVTVSGSAKVELGDIEASNHALITDNAQVLSDSTIDCEVLEMYDSAKTKGQCYIEGVCIMKDKSMIDGFGTHRGNLDLSGSAKLVECSSKEGTNVRISDGTFKKQDWREDFTA